MIEIDSAKQLENTLKVAEMLARDEQRHTEVIRDLHKLTVWDEPTSEQKRPSSLILALIERI